MKIMNRRIVTSELQVAGSKKEIDTYFDKVVKYVPTEIVGAWIAASGLVQAAADTAKNSVMWVCFAVGLVLTALWTLKKTAQPGKSPAIQQAVISTLAFVTWAIALGEPFRSLLGQEKQSLYGSLLLIFYTLATPLIPVKDDQGRS
jgi:hypothetical protein